MNKVVVKIGGSNLKSDDDFASIIKALGYYKKPTIIVVSALYGVTDALEKSLTKIKNNKQIINNLLESLRTDHFRLLDKFIESEHLREQTRQKLDIRIAELNKYLHGINYLGDIPGFAHDMILSYGERLMSLLLSAILNQHGIRNEERLPEQIGLYAYGDYGNAAVDFVSSKRKVGKALSKAKAYIIPGFYGISAEGKVMLFGRGGSDYSAAAIAGCIEASSLDIWKDVPGFLSADPGIVKTPINLKGLSYREAAELSYFGARILHPRTVEPLSEKHIPIRILNIKSFNRSLTPATVINCKNVVKRNIIKSVAHTDDIAILRLIGPGVGIQPGIIANVAAELSHARINIKSIITAQTSINILLSRQDIEPSMRITRALTLSAVKEIVCLDNVSIVAAVGEGMINRPGIAARIFMAVAKHKINVRITSAGASEAAIYFIINKKDTRKAIQAIHEEFFNENNRRN